MGCMQSVPRDNYVKINTSSKQSDNQTEDDSNESETHVNRVIIRKICKLLGEYYKALGKHYDNLFQIFCERNNFNDQDIIEEMKSDELIPNNCALVLFDDNFPFIRKITNDKQKYIFIYSVLKQCYLYATSKKLPYSYFNKGIFAALCPLQSIKYQQQLLFNGFMRHLTNNDIYIPTDIINLCYQFYKIKSPNWVKFDSKRRKNKITKLAKICFKNKEYFMSYQLFNVINNNKHKNHCRMGRILFAWNNLYGALIEFNIAIKFSSNNANYALWAAKCYARLHDTENANILYLRAIELAETDRDKCRYYRRYIQFLMIIGDYEKAKLYAVKAMEINPPSSRGYYYVAFALIFRNLGEYNQSQRYYLAALDHESLNCISEDVHASYGYLLYLMGNYEAALEYIEIELRKFEGTEFIFAHFYNALVNKVIGNDEKAEELLQKAVQLCSNSVFKEQYLQHLRQMKEKDSNTTLYDIFLKILQTN